MQYINMVPYFKKHSLTIILLIIFKCLPCEGQTIKVAIASSLIGPFEEIKTGFESSSKIKIELIAAASGTLTHQIINGAPYDVFVSADPKYTEIIIDTKKLNSSPIYFASGSIVIWSTVPLDTTKYTLAECIRNQIKQKPEQFACTIANTETAPYGLVAKKWLVNKNLWEETKKRIVTGNSISHVNQFIHTSTVDMAFTSLSSKQSLQQQAQGFWYPIKSNKYTVPHTFVILKKSEKNSAFIKYLNSSSTIDILKKYSYLMSNK